MFVNLGMVQMVMKEKSPVPKHGKERGASCEGAREQESEGGLMWPAEKSFDRRGRPKAIACGGDSMGGSFYTKVPLRLQREDVWGKKSQKKSV